MGGSLPQDKVEMQKRNSPRDKQIKDLQGFSLNTKFFGEWVLRTFGFRICLILRGPLAAQIPITNESPEGLPKM